MLEQKTFEKIVSGSQTGADPGALDAVLKLIIPCGGCCHKDRKSEAGPIPKKYPVQDHSLSDYRERTEANVFDSDGTLLFTGVT